MGPYQRILVIPSTATAVNERGDTDVAAAILSETKLVFSQTTTAGNRIPFPGYLGFAPAELIPFVKTQRPKQYWLSESERKFGKRRKR
jgi:hypothetical protein